MPNNLIKYFEYAHLPEHLQAISKPMHHLANFMDIHLPDGAEKTTGLRKLLEAKDCFVREAVGMPNKLKNNIAGEISDGYHTFNELYAHRMQLFACICHANQSHAWKSKHHHPEDGPMYTDYFVVGIDTPEGQFSYHYHLDHWDFFDQVNELKHAPKFDGHTSSHVFRIQSLNTIQTSKCESDNHLNLKASVESKATPVLEDIEIGIKPIVGDKAQYEFQPNLSVKTDENGNASLESKAMSSGYFMSFSEALEALKQGCKVARSGWNFRHKAGLLLPINSQTIIIFFSNNIQMNWNPHNIDLLENDWVVVA